MQRFMLLLVLSTIASPLCSEKILLPVFWDSPGGHGSFFVTELKLYNDSTRPAILSGLSTTCEDRSRQIEIPPKQVVSTFCKTGTPGEIIDVPSDAELHYSLRVRDISRTEKSAGVQLPVIRWADHKPLINLLGIRANNQFRARLRVYSFGESVIYLRAYTEGANREIWRDGLILSGEAKIPLPTMKRSYLLLRNRIE